MTSSSTPKNLQMSPFWFPGSTQPQIQVNYYASYAPTGIGCQVAQRAKAWLRERGVVVGDRYDTESAKGPNGPQGDESAATKILASRVFLIFLDEHWLKQAQCEYDYNIAQLQNLTGSRPIIFPLFCQNLAERKDSPLLLAVRSNLLIHAFPEIEFWRDVNDEETAFGRIDFVLETVLMKHLPDLPRSPECDEMDARVASRVNQLMSQMESPQKNGLSAEMPSGKWVGLMIGTGRHQLRPKATSRWPLELYIRFQEDVPDDFCGHGRDDVGCFIMKGALKEDRQKVAFFFVYIDLHQADQPFHTLSFSGGCHGVCMTGKWTLHDAKKADTGKATSSGYWAMWPESFISLDLLDKCLRKHSAKFKTLIPRASSEDIEDHVTSDMSEADYQSDCDSEMLSCSIDDSLNTSGSIIFDESRPPIQNMSAETAAAVSDIMTALDEQMETLPPGVADLVRRLSVVLTSPPATPLTSPVGTPLPDSHMSPPNFDRRRSSQTDRRRSSQN